MRRKKSRVAQAPRLTERVENALELPTGSLSNIARIELTGNRRAVVEGCRGILEYDDGIIRLNTCSGVVRFVGRDLSMSCLTEDNAVVTGTLLSVEFLS